MKKRSKALSSASHFAVYCLRLIYATLNERFSISSSNEYHVRYYDILIKILKYMPAYSHLRNEEHEKVKYKRGKRH